jgi:hypothetical protein
MEFGGYDLYIILNEHSLPIFIKFYILLLFPSLNNIQCLTIKKF